MLLEIHSNEINQEERKTNSITENELMAREWIGPIKHILFIYLFVSIYTATHITNMIWSWDWANNN